MSEDIINRVAKSGIVSIDLGEYYPVEEIAELDLKPWLFKGLILKEADFRKDIEEYNWQQFNGKRVAVFCSADAIIPVWAYMLISMKLTGAAKGIVFGSKSNLLSQYYHDTLNKIDLSEYKGHRIVIKGCGDKDVPESAYLEITQLLVPIAKTIMYGEPCSTVPVYKSKPGYKS